MFQINQAFWILTLTVILNAFCVPIVVKVVCPHEIHNLTSSFEIYLIGDYYDQLVLNVTSFAIHPDSDNVFEGTFNRSMKSVRNARFVLKRIEEDQNPLELDRYVIVESVELIMLDTNEVVKFHSKWNQQSLASGDFIKFDNTNYNHIKSESIKKRAHWFDNSYWDRW